jgi:hypothetical protein
MDSFWISEWFPRQPQPADDPGSWERAATPLAQFVAELVRRGQVTFEALPAGFVHIRILSGSTFAPEQAGEDAGEQP